MTNPPPVAPVEGHYALLRNGMVARPQMSEWPEDPAYLDAYLEIYWDKDGNAQPATKADLDVRSAPLYDIIATISPADMQAVTDGELERLRAALQNIRALAAKRQHECGPDGNFKAIEEFAVYGLEGKNP